MSPLNIIAIAACVLVGAIVLNILIPWVIVLVLAIKEQIGWLVYKHEHKNDKR